MLFRNWIHCLIYYGYLLNIIAILLMEYYWKKLIGNVRLEPASPVSVNSLAMHKTINNEAGWLGRPSGLRRPTRSSVLSPPPPPVDPSEQLLYWSGPIDVLSKSSTLHTTHGSCPICHSVSVRWADNPTCLECHATDHTDGAHLFSCPTHLTDLARRYMWTAPLQVAQFLAGLSQFSDLPTLQEDFDSLSS